MVRIEGVTTTENIGIRRRSRVLLVNKHSFAKWLLTANINLRAERTVVVDSDLVQS